LWGRTAYRDTSQIGSAKDNGISVSLHLCEHITATSVVYVNSEERNTFMYFETMLEQANHTRSIARQMAREVRPEEMDAIAAGTTSCSSGGADDCDQDSD
jgi:hypothetical protein